MSRRISALPVKIDFDLPYSLRIDAICRVTTSKRIYEVRLSTVYEDNPRLPGADHVENLEYVYDNTNIFAHTNIQAEYDPGDDISCVDHTAIVNNIGDDALDVSNAVISAARSSFEEYHFYSLFNFSQLHNISFEVYPPDGSPPWSGGMDGFNGGFTFRRPQREPEVIGSFFRAVDSGKSLPVANQLYFDANFYRLNGNYLMASANLAISFETALAMELSKVAAHRSDMDLQERIDAATINDLGTKLGPLIFGASMENAEMWGLDFVEGYRWLRTIRNKILHKAEMIVIMNGRSRDFREKNEIDWLFECRASILREVDRRVQDIILATPSQQ